MRLKYDDGGRAAAGFKGKTGDCVVRAIAIATGKPYTEVYEEIKVWAQRERISKRKRRKSCPRTGVYPATTRRYLASLGWEWVPTMGIGTGCTVHLKPDELPGGRLIVRLSRHICAVVDGVIHDIGNPSRGGKRCVYGYWYKPVEDGER